MHRYLICSTDTHIETLCIAIHQHIIVLSDIVLIAVVYLNRQEYGWDGADEGTPVEEYAQDRQDDG